MPADSVSLNPPIQYSIIWLIIGAVLLLLIAVWYGVLFWLTRHKPYASLANLKPAPPGFDLEKLKQKYLQLIDECYNAYKHDHATLRSLHKGLSMTVRYFVHEANHFPAPRLTLADLKRAPYPELSRVVEDYYAKEFAAVEHGNAEASVEAAKDMVRRWA
jgi:hypothetical protein